MSKTAPPNCSSLATVNIRADAHLAALNPQQRFAIEYGIGAEDAQGPLLVVAGAGGSGDDGSSNGRAEEVVLLVQSRRSRSGGAPAARD
jgi:hypothetical protein